MAMDFSTAPQQQGGELIPDNTLAWGVIYVIPSAPDVGKVSKSGRDNPSNKYINYEIELTSGNVVGRKVFGMLGIAGSEKWVNSSMAAVRHILEVGRKWSPQNTNVYTIGANLADGDERMWMELDGLQVAVKVGIEKGKDDFPDKNKVKGFLSPHPDSPTHKDFMALVGGATTAAGRSSMGQGDAWGSQVAAPAEPMAPAAATPARPPWTGAPPPQSGAKAPW